MKLAVLLIIIIIIFFNVSNGVQRYFSFLFSFFREQLIAYMESTKCMEIMDESLGNIFF